MNSLINLMHTLCIIWNLKTSLGQVLTILFYMLSASTRHILAKHDLYANDGDPLLFPFPIPAQALGRAGAPAALAGILAAQQRTHPYVAQESHCESRSLFIPKKNKTKWLF